MSNPINKPCDLPPDTGALVKMVPRPPAYQMFISSEEGTEPIFLLLGDLQFIQGTLLVNLII